MVIEKVGEDSAESAVLVTQAGAGAGEDRVGVGKRVDPSVLIGAGSNLWVKVWGDRPSDEVGQEAADPGRWRGDRREKGGPGSSRLWSVTQPE